MREFGVPADEFADCFKIIMKIIPVTEDVPEVIRISKDCDDESGLAKIHAFKHSRKRIDGVWEYLAKGRYV